MIYKGRVATEQDNNKSERTDIQAPAGSWDIPGSRGFFKIPIPRFSKILSQDFSGFPEALQQLYSKAFHPFH